MSQLVLIVEDESRIAETLERYLRSEGFRVERAKDGKEALSLWRAAQPDLILLDLMLPKVDGLSVLRHIRTVDAVPVIILTAKSEELDKLLGLELGADDYIAKPFSPKEVLARVKAVLRRATGDVLLSKVYQHSEIVVNLERLEVTCHGESIQLTTAQVHLLAMLMSKIGKVFNRKELLTAASMDIADERVIDSHIKNIRQRMGACGEAIQTVRSAGYRIKP